EGYRNFGTKLWNATRFAQMNACKPVKGFDPKSCQHAVNKWIVSEAAKTAQEVTSTIENFRFNDASDSIYKFAWGQYCDWYLELIKPIMNGDDQAAIAETRACAAWVLDQILILLHPFMPFITEELWGETAGDEPRATALISAAWPVLDDSYIDEAAQEDITWLVKLVSEVRSVRSEMNVPPAAKGKLVVIGASAKTLERMATYTDVLERMARMSSWEAADSAPKAALQAIVDEATIALPLEGLIDLGAEKARLQKEIEKTEAEIAKIDQKLANKNFTERAPEAVVAEQHTRRAAFTAELEKLQEAINNLPG
ncbi:MAG TPA: valine--tRNA ligase, partial [Hellea balneolensis]|nr:valine--tRNA ligase [Hellea balneolensis]